jgi:hypothetical protein
MKRALAFIVMTLVICINGRAQLTISVSEETRFVEMNVQQQLTPKNDDAHSL